MRNGVSLKLNFIDLNHVCNFIFGNDKASSKQQIQNKNLNSLRVTRLEDCSCYPDKL